MGKIKLLVLSLVITTFSWAVVPASPWGPGVVNINAPVVVGAGETLVVNPGTIVQFLSIRSITVQSTGVMNVNGTAVSPVQFLGANNGIIFQAGSSGSMSYALVDNVQAGPAGVLLQSSAVVLNNVTVQKVGAGAGFRFTNVSPTLSFCKTSGGSLGLSIDAGGGSFPFVHNCNISATGTAINNNGIGTFYAEGNYYPSGYTSAGTGTTEYQPYLLNDPLTASPIRINGGAGAAGQIDGRFVLANSKSYQLDNGGLTVANGGDIRLGYDVLTPAYTGGSTLAVNGNYDLTVNNGGNFQSPAANTITRAAGNWGSLILQASSIPNITNTTFRNATTAINDQNSSTIRNCTFDMGNVSCIAVNSAGGIYANNTFDSSTSYALDISQTCTVTGNTFQNAVLYPIRISGGSPTIQQNTIAASSTQPAITITGGSHTAGNIINNSISASTILVSATGAADPVLVQNNYWGAALPVSAKFTGANQINFEPWRDTIWPAPTVVINQKPITVNRLTIMPTDNAQISFTPTGVTFDIYDLGYHGGNPNIISITVTDGVGTYTYSAVGAPVATGVYAPFASFVPPIVPAFGRTYTWSAIVRDSQGTNTWGDSPIPSFNFTIQQPNINLVLSTNPLKTAANSGDQINYVIDFTNSATFAAGNVDIVAVLPDDVYFNGTLILQNLDALMGTITARVYSDVAGTALLGTASGVGGAGTLTFTNATGGWVPAASNHLVKHIRVNIQSLTDPLGGANNGQVVYQTIVK